MPVQTFGNVVVESPDPRPPEPVRSGMEAIRPNLRDLPFLPPETRQAIEQYDAAVLAVSRLRGAAAAAAGDLQAGLGTVEATEQAAGDLALEAMRIRGMLAVADSAEARLLDQKRSIMPLIQAAHLREAERLEGEAAEIAGAIRERLAAINMEHVADSAVARDAECCRRRSQAAALRHDGPIVAAQTMRDWEASRAAYCAWRAPSWLELPTVEN